MKKNLFEGLPEKLPEELVTVLAQQGEGVRVERIVSAGHASPPGFWYNQEQSEWVILLSGSAVLLVEVDGVASEVELLPGDYLRLPAHRRHRVESTSTVEKTVWLALFF